MTLEHEVADEEVDACPLCGDAAVAAVVERGVGLRVHECAACGFAYVTPRPTPAAMLRHYQNEYANENLERRWRDSIAFDIQRTDVGRLRTLMGLRGASALDVGCGSGLFLEALRRRGAAPLAGIEPGAEAARFAAARLPAATILPCTYEEAGTMLRDRTFDLVVGFDLIEHVYDPRGFLRWVRERTAPGGLLYLKTPNWEAVHRYGADWEGLWRDFEHVYYFSRSTLGRLLEEQGFGVVHFAYEPYRAGLGGTERIRLAGPKRRAIAAARAALRPIPVLNRAAFAALQWARGRRSREDERRGTAHGLVVAARRA